MVRITIQTTSGRRFSLQCSNKQEVAGLQHQIELATGLPGEKLKLVYKGKTVDQDHIAFSESDVVLVMVTRGAMPAHPAYDEDNEDVATESEETKSWLIFIAWLASIPIAHAVSIGPLYILGSLILVIFKNLGKRQPGEASAYSIFNGFQELPGQLNAGRLDDQLRHGQM